MGLSNEERYKKIVWAIHHIENELKFIQDSYRSESLKKYSGKLWPALLNKSGNSAFWITGGSLDNDSFGGSDLISTAFEVHMEKLLNERQKAKGEFVWESTNDYVAESVSIERLLTNVEMGRNVVTIWKWIESFLYAANRYDDEMSKELTPVKDLISNMQADLFAIISQDNRYFYAYLMNRILEKCVDIYDDEHVLYQTLNKKMHHCFYVDDFTNGEVLMDMWTDIQFKLISEIDDNTRILYTLRCMGRKLVDNKNIAFEAFKDYVDHDAFEVVFDQCMSDKQKYDEATAERVTYNHCDLTWRWKY